MINMKWDYFVCVSFSSLSNLDLDARKPIFGVSEQQRRRPACTSMQTAQHLCYSLIGKPCVNLQHKQNFNFLASNDS